MKRIISALLFLTIAINSIGQQQPTKPTAKTPPQVIAVKKEPRQIVAVKKAPPVLLPNSVAMKYSRKFPGKPVPKVVMQKYQPAKPVKKQN